MEQGTKSRDMFQNQNPLKQRARTKTRDDSTWGGDSAIVAPKHISRLAQLVGQLII